MYLIELNDIKHSYGRGEAVYEALRGVSLRIEPTEKVAIVGRSGSGKTTLLHILSGLDSPTSGTYQFEGRDMSRMSSDDAAELRNRKFGIVVQQFALIKEYTAVENVELPLLYRGVPRRKAHMRALDMLERVGLEKMATRRPWQLSGGQQQRVAIARALVNDPAVLLADEPTGALDQTTASEILNLLSEIHASGVCLIIVTHDLEVARFCDRSIHMVDGRLLSG